MLAIEEIGNVSRNQNKTADFALMHNPWCVICSDLYRCAKCGWNRCISFDCYALAA